jgi:hypothetical protein
MNLTIPVELDVKYQYRGCEYSNGEMRTLFKAMHRALEEIAKETGTPYARTANEALALFKSPQVSTDDATQGGAK